jgi:Ca-activated chloride channel family protein
MDLEKPALLWLLSALPVFAVAAWAAWRRADRWLRRFAGRRARAGSFLAGVLFLAAAWTAMATALAGPRIQVEKVVFNRSGIDLCVGLDVSKSMLAEDVVLRGLTEEAIPWVPNRLNRARQICLDLLSSLQGERFGLYVFASEGVEIVPFTRDYGFCRYVLRHINETEITASGSDLGEAIRAGVAMLEESGEESVKRLLLVSDGEDITADQSSLYESARYAASRGIRIYTVGVGTGRSVLLPIRSHDASGISGYYLDEDGSYLRSSMVSETLERVAALTGGEFFRAGEGDPAAEILQAILKDARQFRQTRSVEKAWEELSALFAALGMVCFGAGVLVRR